jgi:MHS family shikimate/dehydroshikimate transporter-like MFS transporter
MPSTPVADANLKMVVFASTLGATIEWYDFFLYGVVTPIVFSKIFFPSYDVNVGIMLAYATFAVGFVARPIGGIIFGHFGDSIGRKRMLVATLLTMGIATCAIGFLPTYDSAGLWAPGILLALRILQGIGLGGEWGGAVLMTIEHGPADRQGYYGSWPQVGAPAGLCLSAGVVALLSLLPEPLFMSWGWRIAFWISAVLILVGIYIRLRLGETPAFVSAQAKQQTVVLPFIELWRRASKGVLLGIGARYIEGVWFNIYAVFIIAYLTATLHLSRSVTLAAVMVAAVFMMIFMPVFGHLSDVVGRRRVYGFGCIVLGITVFPSFFLMDPAHLFVTILAIAVPLGLIGSAVFGPEPALFSDQFDTEVRYSGISFIYQFSGIFASGLTPLIASALLSYGGGRPFFVCAYVGVVALVSAASVYFMREGTTVRGPERIREVALPT